MNNVPAPNLLPQSRLISRKRERFVGLWSFCFVAICIGVLIPSVLLGLQFRSAKPVEIGHLTRFVSDLEELRTAMAPLKTRLMQLQVDSVSQHNADARVQWTRVLSRLGATTSEQIRIHSFNAEIESRSSEPRIVIDIQIYSDTLSQAREFLFTLEATEIFDEVQMIDSRRKSSSLDSPVDSSIRVVITSGQPQEALP